MLKSRLFQESHAKDCSEIEELGRNCREETERSRQLGSDELFAQKKDEPSTVNQLLSQMQDLQDKVNDLNEEKEFYDPETASSRGMLSRDSGLPHHTRNSMGISGNVFENLPAQDRMSPSLLSDPNNFASSYCEGVPELP